MLMEELTVYFSVSLPIANLQAFVFQGHFHIFHKISVLRGPFWAAAPWGTGPCPRILEPMSKTHASRIPCHSAQIMSYRTSVQTAPITPKRSYNY